MMCRELIAFVCVLGVLGCVRAATSAGALGGLRGLTPMSQMLTYVGVHVIANQVGELPILDSFLQTTTILLSSSYPALLSQLWLCLLPVALYLTSEF